MIIALADKLYSWGRGQRDFAIVTANQILDGLGTVGTKHADIGPTKAEEPSLNCSSLLFLLSFLSLLLLGV